MHHSYPLLEILAAGFTLALIFGYAAKRIGLSPIIGYLVAGFLVGPQSPGFVADAELAMELSEAGVILLMFGVGLHFHLEDLLAVKGISLPGAIFQSAASTLCGFAVAELAGLSVTGGLVMGMGLAVASTVVLLRVLEDNHMVDTIHGHVAVGWLVMEDILTVLVLVLLPSLAVITGVDTSTATAASGGVFPIVKAVGLAFMRLALLWVVVLVIGGKVVPWVLNQVVRTRSQELFTLTVLVAAFATAVGAAVFFEASMALGAFLGGMVVGKSKVSHQAGADLLPFRDAFAVLFFISVGMLLDPGFVLERPALVLAAILIVLVVKPLAAMSIVALLGYTSHTGLIVGISLAQVGEFSFILAQQALSLKLVDIDVYKVLVVCAFVSITINPGLFRLIPRIEAQFKKHPTLWRMLNLRAERKAHKLATDKLAPREAPAAATEAIVVGYGPTGKSVADALCEKGLAISIIDMNVDTVNDLNEHGKDAVYGDATRPEILKAAGIHDAYCMVVTLPTLEHTLSAVMAARQMNGDIRILVRARFMRDKDILKSAGATAVVLEEEEVAVTLTETVVNDVRRCAEEACPMYDETEVEKGK